ncbi:hypothetical protein RCL1_003706 [Eukaryota sp. TZLM3-RCL]
MQWDVSLLESVLEQSQTCLPSPVIQCPSCGRVLLQNSLHTHQAYCAEYKALVIQRPISGLLAFSSFSFLSSTKRTTKKLVQLNQRNRSRILRNVDTQKLFKSETDPPNTFPIPESKTRASRTPKQVQSTFSTTKSHFHATPTPSTSSFLNVSKRLVLQPSAATITSIEKYKQFIEKPSLHERIVAISSKRSSQTSTPIRLRRSSKKSFLGII